MRIIETGPELYVARKALGLSASGLAMFLRLGKDGGRLVRRWQSGETSIPGSVSLLLGVAIASPAARRLLGLPAQLHSADAEETEQ
jgi:hypothetical protein